MVERELSLTKEPESKPLSIYAVDVAWHKKFRDRANEGKVVIKGKERPWQQSRQGMAKAFLHMAFADTASGHWKMFVQDIRTHSGRHRHQGGIAIYVLEGKGWTVVDGVRYDWEEGDLILLPIKPKGVEHQQFNADPGKGCKWLGMIYLPFREALGAQWDQVENSPDWKE